VGKGSFKAFVLDQLAALPQLEIRPMFGGFGLYQAGHFFAIIMAGRVFFKINDQSRADYLDRHMPPFTYEKGRKVISLQYFEVPPEILDDRAALVVWAQRAIQAAMPSAN
jgi:DNA transformation protein